LKQFLFNYIVVRASLPWSKDNHELFPKAARDRARVLLYLGKLLAKQPRFEGVSVAIEDVWWTVMKYAITREI
jgi:hypothetical protein